MKALIQRVKTAHVSVEQQIIGEIKQGILLFLGLEKADNIAIAEKLLEKVMAYRIFSDEQGKMNLSLRDIKGDLLIISQFTLAADTRKGLRPSFSQAMPPKESEALYLEFVRRAKQAQSIGHVASGKFGADMQVSLINDGPVTFLLEQ